METMDNMPSLLRIDGLVERPQSLSYDDLAGLDARFQAADVSRLDPKRAGDAVTLAGLLEWAGAKPAARWLTLHAAADNFHASIPLEAVRDRGLIIYRLAGQPLPAAKGGPVRFLIPDFAACHTHEVDECANVKFVDHLELTAERGYDNRPTDDESHAALHKEEQG